MTNPEVEGLDGNAVRRIIQEVLGADFRLPGLHANQIAAKVNARLTHPLPDGEGGEREKVIADMLAVLKRAEAYIAADAEVYIGDDEPAPDSLLAAIRSLTTSEPRT